MLKWINTQVEGLFLSMVLKVWMFMLDYAEYPFLCPQEVQEYPNCIAF